MSLYLSFCTLNLRNDEIIGNDETSCKYCCKWDFEQTMDDFVKSKSQVVGKVEVISQEAFSDAGQVRWVDEILPHQDIF